MRGIGAVIHFSSPAGGSDTPASELSEAWTRIRDWFPLHVQAEVEPCFRIFYQPDEGTSALDRLKSFLKLQALAFPGRQDNFTIERILGTGETICTIVSGASSAFAPVTLSLSDQEWHTAQPQEESSSGTQLKGLSITNAQIQAWRDLPLEAKREAGGWKVWAQSQKIAIGSAVNFLTNSGLTFRGTERLQPPGERGTPITNTQIQAWQDLSPKERYAAGGWVPWAKAQGISIGSATNFLTNSGLTSFGIKRLKPPEERGSSITNMQIQAWRDLPPEAKREAGGWMTWAQAQGISIGSARSFLTNTGLSIRGEERLQPPEVKGLRITDEQLQEWQNLTPEARYATGGWMTWAQGRGISIRSAANFLTNSGLTPRGVERLQPPEEKGFRITSRQLQVWQNLSPEERNATGGWMAWAQAQGISISSAKSCLTNIGLTPFGIARLQPPEKRGSPITNTQIQAWRDLPHEAKREAGGWMKWAQAQGIAVNNACSYLTNTGLTSFGVARLQMPWERGGLITNTSIRMWRDLSPEAKREAGGWMKWAKAQGIYIGSAGSYLTNTGLTVRGVERLQLTEARGAPVTEGQLLAWLNMSPEQQHASGGWAAWAQAQGISYRSAKKHLAPTESEMPRRGTSPSATVTSDSQLASTSAGGENSPPQSSGAKRAYPLAGEELAAPLAKQIKEEDDAVTWRTHQIDNNLPILQHWRDPTVSVLAQAEGQQETLQVTLWGTLFNRLPRETKARINQDIRWFLQHEGNHDARMNAMMSVAIPLDDRDGYRGRTVYARTDLAAYTVLGPYSGRLLENETVRCEYEKEYGKEAGNYYFATRSQERIVSAWPQGNFLSLINTPVFSRRTAEAEARQNVSAVLVGKNITFFLTTRDISAGEELWFDYGPDYRHFEPGEGLRSVQIKEEPSSSQEG